MLRFVKRINGISRPFWALFLSYCYFLIPFTLITSNNAYPMILGFLTMVFFFLGHFSLNAIYDQEVDRANRRKNELNSWADSFNLEVIWIWIMISIYWIISGIGAFIFYLLYNSIFLLIFILMAIVLAICYSVPPIQVKGRAPMDLFANQLSFGIIGPLFALESLRIMQTVPFSGIVIILIISVSILSIVVLPTIMMDTSIDRDFGYNTFSVKYGMKNTVKVIWLFFVIQLIPVTFLIGMSLAEENLLFFLMMISLIWGEAGFILILWKNPSERIAEIVAALFTSSLFTGGIYLLIIVHILPK
ncbi:MAG: UbiA family prenyltransferase, partial [Candidatus Hodarchaeales archaeon]